MIHKVFEISLKIEIFTGAMSAVPCSPVIRSAKADNTGMMVTQHTHKNTQR